MPNTDPLNTNAQINQPENDLPVPLVPPVAASSLEVADANSTVATAIDNTDETLSIRGQIQIPTLLSRTNKSSNLSEANHQAKKKCVPRSVKRHCKILYLSTKSLFFNNKAMKSCR
ncbi:unnamed protein product [Rotaria sordida]|nr:unnamed protein product [Rotaria sordida]